MDTNKQKLTVINDAMISQNLAVRHNDIERPLPVLVFIWPEHVEERGWGGGEEHVAAHHTGVRVARAAESELPGPSRC